MSFESNESVYFSKRSEFQLKKECSDNILSMIFTQYKASWLQLEYDSFNIEFHYLL